MERDVCHGSQSHDLSCGDSPDTVRLMLREKCQTSRTIANLCDQEVPSVRGRTRRTPRETRTFDDARVLDILRKRRGSERQLGPSLSFVGERKPPGRPAEPRRLG